MLLAICWGLGYAAVVVAAALLGGSFIRNDRALGLTGQLFLAPGAALPVTGLITQAMRSHAWPLATWMDTAVGIGLLMIVFYLAWTLLPSAHNASQYSLGFVITLIAAILILWGLHRQGQTMIVNTATPINLLASQALIMCGGAFLGLSASGGLTDLGGIVLNKRLPHWLPVEISVNETFVRWALFFLAIGLAVDVWWVQDPNSGLIGNAQQAGIAIAWMIYFIALRLKTYPRWQRWAWAGILVVGFVCILPILLNVPWLEKTFKF